MADDWDDAAPMVVSSGGAVVSAEVPDVAPKLFNKWACDDVNVPDMSLQDYICCVIFFTFVTLKQFVICNDLIIFVMTLDDMSLQSRNIGKFFVTLVTIKICHNFLFVMNSVGMP